MTRVRLEALQWFALFGGPLAWAADHVAGYFVAEGGCGKGSELVLGLLAAAVVLGAEGASLLVLRATQGAGKDDPGPWGRLHFFAQAAALGNVLFFVIVVLDAVGTAYHCR
jgi:hypothetical protein